MATILDSLVGSCAKKLQDIITEEAVLILGVKEDLRELQRTVKQINCFLNDAEQRRTEDLAVNNWLGEVKDAMYYADDIIDLARFEGGKLLAESPSSSRKSTLCGGFSLFTCIPNVQKRHEIAVKIKNFNAELDKISKLGERFLKLQNMQPREELPATRLNMKRHSHVEPNLVGKEILHACRNLVHLVLAHKEKKTYKIAIVGTGGVGKTALAQKIYNDQKIKGNFDKQAWICVSQEYSEVALLKEVLRKIGVHYGADENTSELSDKLGAAIENKSLFLVLDDVWQPEVWIDVLRTPLHTADTVIILVTTRQDTVALAIGVVHMHRVELMSVDVGWELLCKSMNISEVKEVQSLQDIGMEIVRKCGGLPLAIKLIAPILARKEKTENQWKRFINKSAWSMSKLPTELRGALYLSYDDLPRYLKQCFLYCTLYPEDWDMHRDYLTMSWVAEGFIEEREDELLEDTAQEYYYELIHRNLLQPDPLYFDQEWSKMHDLLRQLAGHISGEGTFCGDPQSSEAKSLSKHRHISIVTDKDSIMLPILDNELLRARTLNIRCAKPPRVESTIFKRIPHIRILDLSNSLLHRIPDCIGNLIHLRSLDFDGTEITSIPESIGSLIYLKMLNLQRCDALHSLPLAITQLCNLRRLGLNDTPINQVPKGIGRLEFLNDLEGFPIGDGNDNAKAQDGWKLEELGQLSQLRKIHMIKLERAVPCGTYSLLADKKYLKSLNLWCTERTDEPYSEEDVGSIEKIFEQLIPPQNLEELYIDGFFGGRYPIWLGSIHLSSVTNLGLINCKFWVHLPPIGQLPNLKFLRIEGATAVTKVGPEFVGCRELGSFRKLEGLIMVNMPNWEEWSFIEEEDAAAEAAIEGEKDGYAEMGKREAPSRRMRLLPRLRALSLVNCPKLRALPGQLGQVAMNLKRLYIGGADCLKAVGDFLFLSEFLRIVSCDGLERVSNLPEVTDFRVAYCTNLRCVVELSSLQQLWLDEGMKEISSCWVPGLQQQHRQLYDEDLDIYTW